MIPSMAIKEMEGSYYELLRRAKNRALSLFQMSLSLLPPLCLPNPCLNFSYQRDSAAFVEHQEILTSYFPEYYEEEFSSYLQDLKSGFLPLIILENIVSQRIFICQNY